MHTQIKIPTLLALLFLGGILGAIVLFFELSSGVQQGKTAPSRVEITNITDRSFTISWVTEAPSSGSIKVKDKTQEKIAGDERDESSKQKKYTTHSASVVDLEPSTSYTATIISDGKEYQGNLEAWEITTFPEIPLPSILREPAYGTVLTTDEKPADGALVYVKLDGSQKLSALVKASGTWLVPLSFIRQSDGMKFLPPESILGETIEVVLSDQNASALTDTDNDAPVPSIVLGNTYDFRKKTTVRPPRENTDTQLPRLIEPKTLSPFSIELTSPREGARITSGIPLVQGMGIPGKLVTITLGITDPISDTTIIGSDGIWRYVPKKPLGWGRQSITATTTDEQKKPLAMTRTFEILKSGTQVLGEATPSASLTPTSTPAFIPTPTPLDFISPTPQPVPVTASSFPLLFLAIAGAVCIACGSVLYLRTSHDL
ncbi:MAG: fibronectin type III domain-containing protein [bacterium]|nr:fibronectin type III domain-containing protein [bacterium]